MIPIHVKTIIDVAIGDGSIDKRGSLSITHSIQQTNYAAHKAQLLRGCGFTVTENIYTSSSIKNSSKQYHAIYVHVHPEVKTAYKWIYNKGRKAIDKALLRVLDERSLAYWYMDDGTTKLTNFNTKTERGIRYVYDDYKVASYVYCTDRYTRDEVELFAAMLRERFYIESSIIRHNRRDNFYRVYITQTESKDRFKNLVLPYIETSMLYKFKHKHTLKDIPFNIVDISQRERLSESTNVS